MVGPLALRQSAEQGRHLVLDVVDVITCVDVDHARLVVVELVGVVAGVGDDDDRVAAVHEASRLGIPVIAVVDTPWYIVTPTSGQFHIDEIPPGDYHLHIFHEHALPENLQFLERPITIPDSGLTLPLISISETGYIPAPHPDKHGKPYPPLNGYGIGGH